MLGGVFWLAVTVKPPAFEKTSVPLGVEKVMAASLVPVGSADGMLKRAVTTYWLECVPEVPAMVPIITLFGMTPAGGAGGTSVSSVKVTRRLVEPCGAEAGLMAVIWFVAWPHADPGERLSAAPARIQSARAVRMIGSPRCYVRAPGTGFEVARRADSAIKDANASLLFAQVDSHAPAAGCGPAGPGFTGTSSRSLPRTGQYPRT